MDAKLRGRIRRKSRIRKKIRGTSTRPRLTVFRSAKHIYAQVVDDTLGTTLASASTRGQTPPPGDNTKVESAKEVGSKIADWCLKKGISQVVFDRNGRKYHGRVKALAEAARAAGLDF